MKTHKKSQLSMTKPHITTSLQKNTLHQVGDNNMKKQRKMKKKLIHFIVKENLYLGKNDGICDFKSRMKKKSSLISNKNGLKERTEVEMVRVSKEKRKFG